jgi:hypothetical protein
MLIPLAGVVGIVLGIGFGWLMTRKKKTEKTRLGLVLDADEYTLVLKSAERARLEPAAWAKDVVLTAVPLEIRKSMKMSDSISAGADIAFRKLDEIEKEELGLRPESEIEKPMIEQQDVAAGGNECLYLDPEIPSPFRGGECQGKCMNADQLGKICFWPPQTARACAKFKPKKQEISKR